MFSFVPWKFCGAVLPPCSSASNTITSPCYLAPGVHRYTALEINAEVFLQTSSSISVQTIEVDQTFEIKENGILHVDFNKDTNPGAGISGSSGGSGGSFGGRGGVASNMVLSSSQAVPYDNVFNVTQPGSKGGGSGGGKGGGLLHIKARRVVLDGVIRAPGQNGQANSNGGGGSGGGVSIDCFDAEGAGRVEVFGGLGSGKGGGGGGGRLSLKHDHGSFKGLTHVFGGKTGEYLSE